MSVNNSINYLKITSRLVIFKYVFSVVFKFLHFFSLNITINKTDNLAFSCVTFQLRNISKSDFLKVRFTFNLLSNLTKNHSSR